VPFRVAVDDSPVREDDLRLEQLVGCEPVGPPEDAQTTAESQARDPDRRAGAGRDRSAFAFQPGVDRAQGGTGADRRHRALASTVERGLRSITTPRIVERPARQCPPLRAASGSSASRTRARVSTTSSGVLQREPYVVTSVHSV
jgi:hypothetical protein